MKQNLEDIYPLSPLQQGILFHALYSPETGLYTEQAVVTLRGAFSAETYVRAWQMVVDRHPVLRSGFVWENVAKPLQVVFRKAPVAVEMLDWSGLDGAEREARIDGYVTADRRRGFEMAKPPLIRMAIARLSDREHLLVLTFHHAILDGWSISSVFGEADVAYQALRRGETPQLPRHRPFKDYIGWLGQQDMAQAEAFWRRSLGDFTAPTPLPLDTAPAEDHGAAECAGFTRTVAPEKAEELRAFARRHKITMNTLLQGAWSLLLARYAGVDDVVFGTTVSGRPADLPGVEGIVGLLINTLPVRVSVPADARAAEWLAEIQAHAAEMRNYEYSPLVDVQGWSGVPRDRSLFDTLLVFENFPLATGDDGADDEQLRYGARHNVERSNFPLGLAIVNYEGLDIRVTYHQHRFSRETIDRLMEALEALLDEIAADPDRTLGSIPMVAGPARERMLREWNATARPYPAETPAHELFEARAAAAPDAIALSFGGSEVTYGELNARANRLAHRLREMGVGPDVPVAISVDRGPQMVVALLGVLKAGGAYLPVDPAYPAERRAFMLADSGAPVVLTQSHLAENLPETSARVVLLDDAGDEEAPASTASTASAENLGVSIDVRNAAYVIYTSGSTGTPKGVVVSHAGIGNLAAAQAEAFGIGAGSRVLQFASFSFDAAVSEVLVTLLAGATLVLGTKDETMPGAPLLGLLERERVSVATLPPSVLAALPDAELPDLRTVISAGEACSAEVAARWGDGRRFVNAYGPTETTVCATMSVGEDGSRRPTIGRPMANVRAYVLDARLEPVPAGVAGELCVGGAGVARGYLNRAGLTADRFAPDPFSEDAGARIYRTGDRVRWTDEGEIEYLGRADEQVKVRGFRIELGEIEAALAAQPSVRDAVVVAREDVPGDRRLVAYVVAEDDGAASPSALRSALAERLPDHMVPQAIVVLPAFPLTPNGKVDRRALPAPDLGGAEGFAAPMTPTEEVLAGIWSEVLAVPRVGRRDAFFDLGGHSLLATQVASRARQTLGVELPLRAIFEHPVLADLAHAVDDTMRERQGISIPPLLARTDEGPAPLSFAQERLWFLDQLDPGGIAYNMPTALRLTGALDVRALEQALSEMTRRHEVLRARFALVDGHPVQVVDAWTPLALPVDDLSELPADAREAEAKRISTAEARTPFDLAAGPLLRTRLLRLAADEHVLLLAMHHTVSDGWSMGVFFRETAALYRAFADGRPSPLAEPELQYADFAVWQRGWLRGAELERQMAYWRERLAGAPALLELPTDRPRPAEQAFEGSHLIFALPEDVSAAVTAFSRREGATTFMTLLAAWQVLLARYTGQDDVVVGTPIAGRTRSELEGLVGLFLNTLALRTRLDGDPSFREVLKQVRDATLGAYAHQDVPFEKLIDELGVERDLSHAPLFQTMFILQNQPMGGMDWGGVGVAGQDAELGTAKFDLTMSAVEEDGRLYAALEYNTALFDAATAERMAEHFGALLASVTEDPAAPLSTVSLLAGEERRRVLEEWNDTARPYPKTDLLHVLCAEQAARTPDAVAVAYEGERVTFAELDARANRIARALRRRGVGLESRVGVCLDRGPDAVATFLGVMKAGGAYLPLDPSYPADRLAYMLADAGVSVLVATEALAAELPVHDGSVLLLDRDRASVDAEDAEPFDAGVVPESAAYVIYTSGSTGRPKGVVNSHAGICNRLRWMQEHFRIGADDRVMQKTPFGFDVSVWELFWPLMAGATMVPARPEGHREPSYLADLIRREGVTVAHFVPSMLQLFVDEPEMDGCTSLRYVVCSGEALPAPLQDRFLARLPRTELHNLYGPTEAAVDVTAWLCRAGDAVVPIGAPVANTRVYVLDEAGLPLPTGVPGELYLGGVQVARGYLGRPSLTAERFVPDPFSATPGARLYRTGDRTRWRADGNVEYLGRLDGQVKIRGLRIELGEIEAALAAEPGVGDAVVLAREDVPGTRRLVGYVTPADADVAALRAALAARLPDYMVPSAIVTLGEMPLSPNGKVDRKALPAPEAPVATDGDAEPRTEAERILAGIWSGLLGLEKVGIHDNFFAVGGDSILSIQVISRAAQAGLKLTPKQIFQHQTIAALAAVAVSTAGAASTAEQGLVTGDAPLTPIQRWFFGMEVTDAHHWNQAVMLEAGGALDADALHAALARLAEHHDALRLRFARDAAGEWRGAHTASEGSFAFGSIDLSALSDDAFSAEIAARAEEAQASLDFTAGPIFRALHFAAGDGRPDRLLLVVHHLAVDVVSWGVIVADLESAYTQISRGAPAALPPKTTSFAEWGRRLSAHASFPAMEAEAGYWLSRPWSAAARVPVDHAGGSNTVGEAETISLALTEDETRAVLHEVPSIYRTQVNDVLLAALALAFRGWTGGALLVEPEGHGREDLFDGVDLSRSVGWFTSAFPVLLELPRAGGEGAALKAVKEQLRAIPHKGVGFGILRYLSGDAELRARLAAIPRPEVGFNYLGQVDAAAAERALFHTAPEPTGAAMGPHGERHYLLDVAAAVGGGRLVVSWTYGPRIHDRATVQRVAEAYLAALRDIIAHCREADAGGFTPSDFPLAPLTQAQVDRIVAGQGGPAGIEDVYPLSPLQQGMLFHARLSPGSAAYFEQVRMTMRGRFDPGAFARAWQGVADRHSVFRSAFVADGLDAPVQVVHRRAELPVDRQDWRGRDDGDAETRIAAYLAADLARGFRLDRAPLTRIALIRTGEAEWEFVWSSHHILLDGWSMPQVLGEVSALYDAYARGETARLPHPRPYRDYVAWLARQDRAAAEGFWRRAMAGFGDPVPLPTTWGDAGDGDAPASFAQAEMSLSREDTDALQAFARGAGLTLNTVMQGAWALLLARYTGRDDVTFGSTVSGRPADLPGVEQMVGMLINTIPVRVRVPGDARTSSWLHDLQALQMEARHFDYTPLVDVQGWSEVPRERRLFDTLFVFENYPAQFGTGEESEDDGGLEVTPAPVHERTNYPVTVGVVPGEQVRVEISYDADRFAAAAMSRLAEHYRALLRTLPASADAPLASLEMLGEAERRELLADRARGPHLPSDGVETLHGWVERWAEATPHATAVEHDGASLTYAELNAAANRIAHRLIDLGAEPEARIGLCIDRSPEMVAALLGILKSGAAYVPLDPAWPADRMAYVADDAGLRVAVTAAALADRLPPHVRRVLVDARSSADAENPGVEVAPDGLAYVIYTSGSTGRPKGVLVPHAGPANYVRHAVHEYGLTAADRMLQFASVAFDASVEELFAPLACGGTMVLRTDEMISSPETFLARCGEWGVTVAPAPTAFWHQLAAAMDADALELPASLRLVVIGGERAMPERVAAWHRAVDGRVALYNSYGPTEASVAATGGFVTATPGEVSIGRPIANDAAYVLDAAGEPVPVGVAGELYLGGAGVARGYLGRPGTTAEAFVPDPFSGVLGARMYRTGDRARWLEDGGLAFLGRVDEQVKVRGFRIEPGEIEAALVAHSAVRDAAVIARPDASGTLALAAYVVPASGDAPSAADLRAFLAESLPDYMVPAAFVSLPALPLTTSGKVDRRALPAPDAAALSDSAFVAPRTPTEELVASAWREVLGAARVGIHDNFFALGGHSLVATRVISRIRALGVELPLRALFDAPTVAALATRVDDERRAGLGISAPPLVRVERDGPAPLSFAQERLWFLDRLDPGSATYNMPTALRLGGALNTGALERAFTEIVRRHESLRTSFAESAEGPVQVVAPASPVHLAVTDLSALPEDEREAEARRLAAEDARRPFDLAAGPLFHASLLRLADDDHVLLVAMHHAVSDGWSMDVFFRETFTLYAAFLADRESPLPELPVQYADFAVWQRDWLRGGELERQLGWWREHLAGAPPVLELPTDRPRPPVQGFRGRQVSFALPAALANRVAALARAEDATLFMTLLAAWQVLLARYSGQDDVVVGTPVAGRAQAETEGLIGLFVNTLAMRANLAGDPAFRDVLKQVREATLGAYAHQDVPFEKLIDALNVERDLSHSPLFQAMFVLQNAPAAGDGDAGGLRVAGMDPELNAAKFDLTLNVAEHADGLAGMLEYSADLFDRATAERIVAHFAALLEALTADPAAPLSALDLLSADERKQLLSDWSTADSGDAWRGTAHDLFARQAAETPDAVALTFRGESLTYAQVDARANRLAHTLREMGVGPEIPVAISVERGPEMVIALLAVLKAGGAYLPVDPTYPAERRAFMLADSAAPVILTQSHLAADLPARSARVVLLDQLPGDEDSAVDAPAVSVDASTAAYIIYTSGSTGTPKGVVVTHAGIGNLAAAQAEAFRISRDSRVLQFASFSFDAAVSEVLVTLLAGATLVLGTKDELMPGAPLLELMQREQVSVATLPPSVLSALPDADLPALRTVVSAGEACTQDVVARWSAGRHFVNAYGPTETTVCATMSEGETGDRRPTIGQPIANARMYVLDRAMQPVPVGVPGELCVGGIGVARGYLGRAGLTADRFVPDAFSDEAGARLYRTGDRVRWTAAGELEYLGRLDEQVKIRGFRIELGEIEAALAAEPGVVDAVVIVREDVPGAKRLVAYVTGDADAETLRIALATRLPEYMVPGAIVTLDALPLTPNGKVDRKALPAPEAPVAKEGDAEPRTEAERILAGIWSGLLGREKVGIHDNFFAVGGDSILSIQVISRATQAGLKLTPKQIFQHQTIAALAAVAVSSTDNATTAEQGLVTGDAPLTPIQRWFFELGVADPHHWNQATIRRIGGSLDSALLERALEHVAAHHDALRLRFANDVSGEWTQAHAGVDGAFGFERIDLSAVPEAELGAAIEAHAERTQRSLDFIHGPLLRAVHFACAGGDRLLLVVHHLAVDAVSWGVLLADLETAYTQLSRGETVALPPKTTSYREWASHLAQHASTDAMQAEAHWWLGRPWHLATPLPVDHADGEDTQDTASTVDLALDEETTRALLHEVPSIYRTQANEVLLAALARAFQGWTGSAALAVEMEGHGREDLFDGVDLSRTAGWFTSVFPVLVELPRTGGEGAALKAVKEQVRAIPNRGIGFGILRHLSPESAVRDALAALPRPEVGFNYFGQMGAGASEDGLLAPSAESYGATVSPRGRRTHLLDVTAMVAGGRLVVSWGYSPARHDRATIERLANAYEAALRAIVAHCRTADAGGFTPSDFPLAPLTQAELDRVAAAQGGAAGIEDVYALSPLQGGMLFHTRLQPESGAYFEQLRFTLRGASDEDAMVRAWREVVARHAILRTAFVADGLETPVQVVHRTADLPVERHDWRDAGDAERSGRLAALLEADRARGIDLTRAPLMRLTLVRTADDVLEVVWSHHHILLDGWSLPQVMGEVWALYDAFAAGRTLDLPRPRPFRDYIAWLAQRSMAGAEAFWRRTLEGFTTPTALPGDARPGTTTAPVHFAEETSGLTAEETERLQAWARDRRLTLNTLLQGAWALLLARYSGETDVAFGNTVSGRPAEMESVEQMVGMLINTIPVRVAVPDRAAVLPWLMSLQDAQMEARDHDYAPLVQVQRWSDVDRDRQLFDSLFVFENYPSAAGAPEAATEDTEDADAPPLAVDFDAAMERTNYPLVVSAAPAGRLLLRATYDAGRFTADGIARMLRHYATLLRALPDHADTSLSALEMLSADERRTLVNEWNATTTEYPRDTSIPALFAAQAQKTPSATAVHFVHNELTYTELDVRSNRLGNHLRAAGVGLETRVGISMERSADLVVALLAILKAGAAYVPLDPSYPADRLAFMLDDSEIGVLLVADALPEALASFTGTVVSLSGDAERIAAQSPASPEISVFPESLAYVVYTSGSTGKPKGIGIPHSAVVRLVRNSNYVQLGADERVAQVSNASFDAATFEIWGALLNGASLIGIDRDVTLSPERFVTALREMDINTMFLTTALFNQVAREIPDGFSSLDNVLFGGEAVDPSAVRAVIDAGGPTRLLHVYGPTESTTFATWHLVDAVDENAATVPIGAPLSNTTTYVLDREMQPVAMGVNGELYIGGDGLARGYLGRAGLTAERFVPNPFIDGQRLYRTGDAVRWNASGTIEFVGRLDEQVKIRGFRIELGEIEAAL
ncbi:MAG TPA: non-ribosomal peptide synthase/polyketide synthase, partial [Longimicrobiaceae bacterium]|nr:non-ribosomal peptide synthase/polyketide synthase [Longimicrobiaceae bacterium]